jgi:hypothetical protein
VLADKDGRQLQVFKSYTDGIFFTDPVTLVIRDADDRTVADTDYGRNVAIACWRGAACAVFRYDEFWSVLPEGVWRLEGGTLVASDSRWLAAIGVIAPLWDDAAGYALMFATVAFPAVGLWLFRQPRSRAGQVLLALAAILTAFYALMWLYAVALLSRLLFHAVGLTLVAGGGGLALLYWSALKSGIRTTTLARTARAAVVIVCVVCAAGFIVASWRFHSGMRAHVWNVRYEQPDVQVPLATARLTRHGDVLTEAFVTVAAGVRLADVVDMRLFDSFDPRMTRDAAEERLGPPSGRWDDPVFKVRADYYERPSGRVSLVRQGAWAWSVVGHPSDCGPATIIRDQRLRNQLVEWLPEERVVQIHVLRDIGWGGVTIHLGRLTCDYMILTGRDGEPAG